MNDEELVDYKQYQTSLRDQASAYESTYVIGKIKGIEQEKINIAKKLLKEKINIATIKLGTGLSDKELEKLINSIDNKYCK